VTQKNNKKTKNKPMNAGKTLERLNAGRLKSLWEREESRPSLRALWMPANLKKMLIDMPPISFSFPFPGNFHPLFQP
jgi:hypothetical protein